MIRFTYVIENDLANEISWQYNEEQIFRLMN